MNRLPATCAAIRRARTAALDLALEADMDGRAGTARALRRKVNSPRNGDWKITHDYRTVVVQISAYGAVATGKKHTALPKPETVIDEKQLATAAQVFVLANCFAL